MCEEVWSRNYSPYLFVVRKTGARLRHTDGWLGDYHGGLLTNFIEELRSSIFMHAHPGSLPLSLHDTRPCVIAAPINLHN